MHTWQHTHATAATPDQIGGLHPGVKQSDPCSPSHMVLRTPDQIGGLLRLEPSNLTMQPYQRWVGAANPGPDRGAPTPGAEQSELLSCVMLSHVCVPILIHPSTNHECLSGGGDSCGSTHTLVTVHWIPCACNCGLVSSRVSPQSVRGVAVIAPHTDISHRYAARARRPSLADALGTPPRHRAAGHLRGP